MGEGKVFLVGAGPGDPELITLKGKRLLEEADVVLYDNLVSKKLLSFALKARLVFVGKSCGRHTMSQEQINAIMIGEAKKGKLVVRLKGGDPFIFGRLAEEMEALEKAGVDFEVVPGVTAASAAAAAAKISLTHREKASVVSFITGHRKGNKPLDIPFAHLAGLKGTLVFYMGVSTSKEIERGLIEAGLPFDTPVLIACSVGNSRERFIKTTISELAETISREKVTPPSLIIVGRVVEER